MRWTIPIIAILLFSSAPADLKGGSLGDTATGSLEGGREIPWSGPGFQRLPFTKTRGFNFGVPDLVDLLQTSARTVHQETGAILFIGNLSRERGGDIPQSRSHNSGRDADIAFPLLDRNGASVTMQDFVALGPDLLAQGTGWTLDVPTLWRYVECFLNLGGQRVAWMFVYSPIRNALLRHAADRPLFLQLRAATVLKQPSDSAPHDDHMHIRIYCPEEDLPSCADGVARWPWIPPLPPPAPLAPVPPRANETEFDLQLAELFEETGVVFKDAADLTQWQQSHESLPKMEWRSARYRTFGCPECTEGPFFSQIERTIESITARPQLSLQAQSDLMALTGNPRDTRNLRPARAKAYWAGFWQKNRHRYGAR